MHHVQSDRVALRVLSQVSDVERLIAERWVEVVAVAGALLERLTLSRADLRALSPAAESGGEVGVTTRRAAHARVGSCFAPGGRGGGGAGASRTGREPLRRWPA